MNFQLNSLVTCMNLSDLNQKLLPTPLLRCPMFHVYGNFIHRYLVIVDKHFSQLDNPPHCFFFAAYSYCSVHRRTIYTYIIDQEVHSFVNVIQRRIWIVHIHRCIKFLRFFLCVYLLLLLVVKYSIVLCFVSYEMKYDESRTGKIE